MRETRNVQTVFTIDDNEHNRKLKDITAQYKLTAEQIKTVSKEMDTGGDKVKTYKEKYDLLEMQLKTTKEWQEKYQASVERITGRIGEYQAKVTDITNKKAALKDEIKRLTAEQGENSDAVKNAQAQLDKLTEEESQYNEEIRKSEGNIRKYNTLIEKQTQNQMHFKHELDKTRIELKKQESALYQSGLWAEKYGEKMVKAGKKMEAVGSSLTRHVTVPTLAVGGYAIKAANDFESAFVGVTKTIDEADVPGGYDAIKKSIREMAGELPSTHEEIAKVVEVAGQLGIEGESLMSFSKVMIDLGETTDVSAEQAAISLARFANVTGLAHEDFDRMGAAIVDLGNNYAAMESEIINMSTRLAAAGTAAGMSQADILGLATGLTSLGLEAEAGGSAFSKLIKRITVGVKTGNEDLTSFADIAGVSTTEFKAAFEEDATKALELFLGGLSKVEEEGGSAIVALDEIGITELRMSDATLRAAGGFEGLTEAIKTGNIAWEDNTALIEEAEKRYESSESQMLISKNRIKDTAIELGNKLLPHVVTLVEKLADLIEGFERLDPKTQDFLIKLGTFAAVTGPAVKAVGGVTKGVGGLMDVYGKIAKKSTGLDDALKKTTGVFNYGFIPTVGLALGAIGLFAGALWLADAPNRIYAENIKDVTEGIGNFAKEVDDSVPIIKDFNEAGTVFDESIEKKKNLISKVEPGITKIYRDNIEARRTLTKGEIDEINRYTDLLDAFNDENVAKYDMRFNIAYQALEKETSVNKTQAAMNLKTIQEYDKARTDLTNESYEKKLLIVHNGIEAERVLREAGKIEEADMQKKYNEQIQREAERQRDRELIDANESALSYIELNLKKYKEGNKVQIDGLMDLSDLREQEVKINRDFNSKLAKIDEEYEIGSFKHTSAKIQIQSDHFNELEKLKKQENWMWNESNKEFAGALMEQVNLITLHGGEIDTETSDLVGGILSSMSRAKDGSKNFSEMMELSVQAIIDKEPELAGEAEKLKDNLNKVFEGIKDGKYENGEDIINALTDGITTTTSKARLSEFMDGYIQLAEQKMSELAPALEDPIEDAKMTLDDFAGSIGISAEEAAEALNKASAQVEMSTEELMYAITAWGEGSIEEFTEMHLDKISSYEQTLDSYITITTGGMSRLEQSSTVSLKTFKKNMEANQKAVEKWTENTRILMKAGVSEGIIAELSKLGPSGANIASDWVKELEDLNGGTLGKFDDLNKGAKTFLNDFNDVYTGGLEEANEAAKFQHELNDYGGQGAFMVGQFIAGMIAELPYMKEMAEKMGYDTGTQTKLGLDKARPAARHSGYRYREEIIDEFSKMPSEAKDKATKTGQGVADGIDSKRSTASTAAAGLRKRVTGQFDGMDGMGVTRGRYFTEGVADGIGSNAYLAARAASRLAGRVKRSFDATLEINSPSEVMKRSGGWIPKGVALGIEVESDEVEKAMQRLAEIPAKASLLADPEISAETIIRNDQSGLVQLSRTMQNDRVILNRLLNAVESIEKKNPDLLLDGDKLIGGVIDRIDEQTGFKNREGQLAYGG